MKKLISVRFKRSHLDEGYNSSEYTYSYNLDNELEVGDIVAVDTRHGVNLAEVSSLKGKLNGFSMSDIKEVKSIVYSKKEEEKKEELRVYKEQVIDEIRTKIKVNAVRESLNKLAENDSKLKELVGLLSDEDLLKYNLFGGLNI